MVGPERMGGMDFNMKKIVIGFIILAAFLGLLFWISQPSNTARTQISNKTGGQLAAEESWYDFGTISMKNGSVSHIYKVKNPSDKPMTITKLYTSCMCTKAAINIDGKKIGPYGMPGHGGSIPIISETLGAVQEAEVEVTFDPAAHGAAGVGRIDRTVFIESAGNSKFELKFTAMVTP